MNVNRANVFPRPRASRWNQQDPLGYVEGASLYEFVGSGPVGNVDPTGLRTDYAVGIDVDFVPIFGVEFGFGLVYDSDAWWESGMYLTGGPAGGANIGAAVVGTVVPGGDLEGTSGQIDVNAGKIGGAAGATLEPNPKPVASVGVGPGAGASASITKTATMTLIDAAYQLCHNLPIVGLFR